MNIEEAWATYVSKLSQDDANLVAQELVNLRMRRAAQLNCEAAEFIIFLDSRGRNVLAMPDVEEVGF